MIMFDAIKPIGNLCVGLANEPEELTAAQELRYQLLVLAFNQSSEATNDKSEYDAICDHLIVKDMETNQVIGTYRLLSNIKNPNQEFLCESEFDISNLRKPGIRLLELGRAVVHSDYRNGPAIKLLLHAIFEYASLKGCRYVFGTSSLHGVDPEALKHALSYCHYHYLLEDKTMMCYAKEPCTKLDLLPENEINMDLVKQQLPPLIRMYCMLGCRLGEGAYFDYEFNSTDVLTVMDSKNVNTHFAEKMFGKSYSA